MTIDGVQLKIKFPYNLHQVLQRESEATAVTMADLVRLAVAQRYVMVTPEIVRLARAYTAGVITAQELADQITMLTLHLR